MATLHATTFSATTLREGEAMPVITLYSKAGCHLCDQARTHLEDLAADHELELQEIDIRGDPAVFERYRFRIPVIAVDGEERLEGRIEASQVADLLAPRS